MKNTTKQPQFKDLTFNSKKEFNSWLIANNEYVIDFDDLGQDLLRIWVHATGEILDANLQQSIWNGLFVNVEKLNEYEPIEMWMDEQWTVMGKLVIDQIRKRPEAMRSKPNLNSKHKLHKTK